MEIIAGVVCDNYKIEAYKKEIKKKGYKVFNELPVDSKTIILQVKIDDSEVKKFAAILESLERIHKNSNKN